MTGITFEQEKVDVSRLSQGLMGIEYEYRFAEHEHEKEARPRYLRVSASPSPPRPLVSASSPGRYSRDSPERAGLGSDSCAVSARTADTKTAVSGALPE